MATALVGAFAGRATIISPRRRPVLPPGHSGEIAYEQAGGKGTGSYRTAVIDAISLMNGAVIEARRKSMKSKVEQPLSCDRPRADEHPNAGGGRRTGDRRRLHSDSASGKKPVLPALFTTRRCT
jgi:hypothetical protein